MLGWLLLLLGLAALVLPGPGLLLTLAGLVLLARNYTWAARLVAPVRRKAYDVARQGVATVPRILLSLLMGLALFGVGVLWFLNPTIPTVGPIGPRLPAGGWGTGLTICVSGVVALGTIIYSIVRFRGEPAVEMVDAGVPTPR